MIKSPFDTVPKPKEPKTPIDPFLKYGLSGLDFSTVYMSILSNGIRLDLPIDKIRSGLWGKSMTFVDTTLIAYHEQIRPAIWTIGVENPKIWKIGGEYSTEAQDSDNVRVPLRAGINRAVYNVEFDGDQKKMIQDFVLFKMCGKH